MYIICGLGNPGKEYETTRHNMGFLTMDVLSSRLGISINRLKFRALIGEGFVGGEKVVLVKPQTFMNLSGESLREVVGFYKPEHDHLLLIYDDIDLAPGMLRIRKSGSAGTHNGMRSVVGCTGRTDLPRLRVGVGHKPDGWDLADWVLSRYATQEERAVQFEAFLKAADAVLKMAESGVQDAMQLANASSAAGETAKDR